MDDTIPNIVQHIEDNWQFLETSSGNSTLKRLEDFTMDSNFARLLCSLVLVIVWVTYITYYHSRVLGFILTKIINRNMFLKQGYFRIGKSSVNWIDFISLSFRVLYLERSKWKSHVSGRGLYYSWLYSQDSGWLGHFSVVEGVRAEKRFRWFVSLWYSRFDYA